MGRPLNSKFFGPGAGKIAVTFNDGSNVVTGHIVKQTGTRRYIVSSDGINEYEVTLATSEAEASLLAPGSATIPVTDAQGGITYVTNLQSCTVVTTAGTSLVWSPDPDVPSEVVLPVKQTLSHLSNGLLSSQATKDGVMTFAGVGNFANNYQIARNAVHGIELGLKIHKNKDSSTVLPVEVLEDNTVTLTVPAEPLVIENSVQRAGWCIAFSLVSGLDGVASRLNDFNISLTIDFDPKEAHDSSKDITLVRQPNSEWNIGAVPVMAIDQKVLELANVALVDQNIMNIGYEALDAYRPLDIEEDWAETMGYFNITLKASKDGIDVAAVKIKVITDPAKTW